MPIISSQETSDLYIRVHNYKFIFCFTSNVNSYGHGGTEQLLNKEIVHVVSCIPIFQVSRKLFEHKVPRHLQRDQANTNAMKQTCDILSFLFKREFPCFLCLTSLFLYNELMISFIILSTSAWKTCFSALSRSSFICATFNPSSFIASSSLQNKEITLLMGFKTILVGHLLIFSLKHI